MRLPKTQCEVQAYEIDGAEVSDGESLRVASHWNRDEMIVIKVGTRSMTVLASELERAIRNCSR